MPKCSSKIFNPMRIKMIPPASSALFLYLLPNMFPTNTPMMEITNVVIPMIVIAGTI